MGILLPEFKAQHLLGMQLPILRRTTSLDPQQLSDVAHAAMQELLREGEAANTLVSYRSALRYWAAWYALRFGEQIVLPVPPAAVLQFIVDHAQRSARSGLKHELPASLDDALVQSGFKGKPGPLALNTLTHRLAVLSKSHQLRNLPNPYADPKVKDLISKTRRAYAKRGQLAGKKDALTLDLLNALLATCDDSLRGKRDRALLLFAWSSGGRRRSEVAGADLRFLKPSGAGEFVYNLAHTKTNQSGRDHPGNYKPVVGAAAVALSEWLQAAGISDGAVFRRILKGGQVGGPMSPAAVREIVKQRCAIAGLAGDYSAHSLRSGFVTEADRQGVSVADTMAMTGHRSVETLIGYTRATKAMRSVALQTLGPSSVADRPG